VNARRVVFSPRARNDLRTIYEWISARAGERVAINYIDRLERFCLGFDIGSERGHRRDDIRLGLRIAGFERRVTLAFSVEEKTVTMLRVFYGGQNWEDEL
jgi:toxin ParE1/3/4